MFSLFVRGRIAPQDVISPSPQGPIRLDEARLAAWALALGETRPSTDPPPNRRPHRGTLPDVDWSNAEPLPARRSLLRLIALGIATRILPMASLGNLSFEARPKPDDSGRAAAKPATARPQGRHAVVRPATVPRRRAA